MFIFHVTIPGMGCIKKRLGEGSICGCLGMLDMHLLRNGQNCDAH